MGSVQRHIPERRAKTKSKTQFYSGRGFEARKLTTYVPHTFLYTKGPVFYALGEFWGGGGEKKRGGVHFGNDSLWDEGEDLRKVHRGKACQSLFISEVHRGKNPNFKSFKKKIKNHKHQTRHSGVAMFHFQFVT